MELEVGQRIRIDLREGKIPEEAEVLGRVKYYTYIEYLAEIRGNRFWLESGIDWRLWKKVKPSFKLSNLRILLEKTKDMKDLLGQSWEQLGGLYVEEIGFAQALRVEGEVEGMKLGDKLMYIEGLLPAKTTEGFVLGVIEVYDDEIEYSEGKEVALIAGK